MSENCITITQGEIGVGSAPDTVIATILGSCVAVCLWDEEHGVGGMNHILVALTNVNGVANDFAGVNAMELLINGIVRRGGLRSNLKAKVFGGAKMVNGLSDIGRFNGVFVTEFLEREKIPCISRSLGGTAARHVRFYPTTGKALQKTVNALPDEKPVVRQRGNDVELF